VRLLKIVREVMRRVRPKGRRESAIALKLRRGRQSGEVVELSRAEARFLFDRTARRELNMSGAEFLRRLDAGDIPDSPVAEHLALLAGGARTSA
jgi:hypothetical protein